MNATQKLIALAMDRQGLTKRSDVSRLANWTRARLSNYTRGVSQADEDAARTLAKLAMLPEDYAVLLIEADRAKTESMRRALLSAAERLAA